MLFILLIILCIVLLSIRYKIKICDFWRKKNVTQVTDLMWTYMLEKQSLSEICKTIYDKHDSSHIGTSMGFTRVLIVKKLKDVEAVLTDAAHSFHSRGIQTNPNDILANNILFMGDYKKWKLIRQKIGPVYTSEWLRRTFNVIERCARDFVELAEDNQYLRKTPFKMLYTYTTGSIAGSIFGIDSKTSSMDSPLVNVWWKSLKPSFKTNIQVFIANVFPKLFKILHLKFFGDHESFFMGFMKKVLKIRWNNRFVDNIDFVALCISLQKHGTMFDCSTGFELNPTDEILAAQAFVMFIAGADTTANAMNFILIELSNNPDILSKLHKEIDEIFGAYKEELTHNDVNNLCYLDMIISEALRKFPPIGIIQRVCTKDTVLPTGLEVEKDTAIIIPVYAIHRDENYYPHPEVFDPERFQIRYTSTFNNFSYIPFGEGGRICIGAKFAHLQLKTALAWLLRRFTLAEQNYTPKFERHSFALRDSNAHYTLIVRDL